MSYVRTRLVALVAMAALLAVSLGGNSRGLAQDATPAAGPMMAMDAPHPAHVHSGTCDTLGAIVAPLADVQMVAPAGAMASPAASPIAGGAGGATSAIPAAFSVTTLTDPPLALADLLSADHAINVHLSAEEIGVYIACGAIGGTPDEQGNLFIGLAELNGSGYSGTAWLHDNGDGTTTVTVFLAAGLSGTTGGGMATPAVEEATPAA